MVSGGCGHPEAQLGLQDPLLLRSPRAWRVSTGCWQEASVLRPWASPRGCFSVLTTWQLLLPGRVVPESRGSPSVRYDLIPGVVRCHFCRVCFTLVTRSQSLSPAHTQEEENWAPALEGKHTFLEGKKTLWGVF